MSVHRFALLGGIALAAVTFAPAGAQETPEGEHITESGVVQIRTLPEKAQAVLEGDDGKYYGIDYYTYVEVERELRFAGNIPRRLVG